MSTSSRCVCPACQATVVPRRPTFLDRVAYVLAWAYCLLAVFAGGLMGPFLLLVAPVLGLLGAGLLGPLHARAFDDPRCPACGRYFPVEAARAPVDRPAVRPVVVEA